MRNSQPTPVEVDVSLHLVGPAGCSLPVWASLRYDPADPYAVHVVFHAGGIEPAGEVSWSFARELLSSGLREPSGIGDVRVWPWQRDDGPAVALALSSPDGHALFEVPRRALADFLGRAYAEVAAGAETRYVDIDGALAALLGTRGSESR
ncbi:MAG TPA: SsgA family sporulation/cell division regulator [Cryptosporangiaceae bacterium]|nr:SsgA family sporulation/cell division regulator [Cryptosporangiaceae bacterium]